jgi:hypothetical protein
MSRLKNRNSQVPNGLTFLEPATGWKPVAWSSFDSIVSQIIAHRKGNPHVAMKHRLSTDQRTVENELDAYNAAICESRGWTEYIMAPAVEAPLPKFKALSPFSPKQLGAVADKTKKVWEGVRSLNDWIDSKEPAVSSELSENRALTCVACPMNGKGGLEAWFTKPAAEIIKRQFEKLSDRKLKTSVDETLGVCEACLCPMRLKVHAPLQFITSHMGEESRKALDPKCWILAEERAKSYS